MLAAVGESGILAYQAGLHHQCLSGTDHNILSVSTKFVVVGQWNRARENPNVGVRRAEPRPQRECSWALPYGVVKNRSKIHTGKNACASLGYVWHRHSCAYATLEVAIPPSPAADTVPYSADPAARRLARTETAEKSEKQTSGRPPTEESDTTRPIS